MPDTQIVNSQVAPVPSTYVLPASSAFVLKAVTAEFTDDGASGDWLPTVLIVSDSGHLIANASDQAVKVTGGDDASVSWFPGVKHAAASSVVTGSYRPPPVFRLSGPQWEAFDDRGITSGFTSTVSTAVVYGGYYQSTANGSYFVVGAPLGPHGGKWGVNVVVDRGPDVGILLFEWQTTLVVDGEIPSPSLGGSWYNVGTGIFVVYNYDLYAPGLTRQVISQGSPLQITGDTGEMLSANGTGSTYGKMVAGGDGSVWWWLRAKVNGKNAASAGFRMRLYSLGLVTADDLGFQPF